MMGDTMRQYLSFGGGVNSTAMLLLLTDRDEEFETVFVNHGGDYPETYEYVDYLRDQGFEITEIIPDVEGYHTIYEYSIAKQILPSFRHRWCTDKFKIRQINNYIQLPCVMFIGFDYSESKRSFKNNLDGITNQYPLMDAKMDRNACIDLIRDHGLDIPPKSGCWFCPFIHKIEIRELFLNHRDLYDKALKMEENCMKDGFYIKDKPLPDIAMAHTPPLQSYFRDYDPELKCSPTTDNEHVKELLKRIIEHPDKHTFSIRDFGFRGSVWGHVVASLIKEKLIKKVSTSSGRHRYIQIAPNEKLAERLRNYGKL